MKKEYNEWRKSRMYPTGIKTRQTSGCLSGGGTKFKNHLCNSYQLKKKDKLIAKQFKQRLSRIVKIVDFKVFGSRAKGMGDKDSDLDIFIEVEQLDKSLENRILHISWEVGFNNYIVISPLIYTKNEIENTPARSSDIIRNIFEEGVTI